jgi:histidyl-tRNA synthetase
MALRAPSGMNDTLPEEVGRFQTLERAFQECMHLAGFREVRTPLLETTSLFSGAIGEITDVVEKEMYSFTHREEPLTLRPEGTAGVVRAYIEHKVQNREPLSKWYYMGAMFRAERPQKGRYRQFHQLGAEVFGDPGPHVDAEVIDLLVRFIAGLGIAAPEVLLNTIGSEEARSHYRTALIAYLEPKKSALTEESQRRLERNPLRILDSKSQADQALLADAPTLHPFLSEEDQKHFDAVRRTLDALGTPYRVDQKLVRGLDYYTRTLFEIKAAKDKLGAGDTVAGGGRYDGLVASLGGPSVPAFGFGAGLERLLIAAELKTDPSVVDVVVLPMGDAAVLSGVKFARQLRDAKIRTEVETRGSSMKAALRRANALGARYAVLIGDRELESGLWALKDLNAHAQEELSPDSIVAKLSASGGAR